MEIGDIIGMLMDDRFVEKLANYDTNISVEDQEIEDIDVVEDEEDGKYVLVQ